MPRRVVGAVMASLILAASLAAPVLANNGKPGAFIPLWYNDTLVTSLLPRGAEPGQPGFIPLPAAQAGSSNDTIYVIQNNPQQSVTPEVIAHVPGDPEYTGGRWKVMFVVFNDAIPAGARPNVTSVAQIDALIAAGAVDIVDPGVSFVCPVVSLSFPK